MTLLLGTVTTAGVVISADGFSIKNEKEGRRAIGRTTLQKVFTDESRLGIAHYGENVVEGRTIASILRELVSQVPADTAIRDVALDLQRRIPIPDGGIWVAGFDAHTQLPVMYVVLCAKGQADVPIELRPCALHRAGAGAEFVHAEEKVGVEDLRKVAGYHETVYDTALENQRRSNKPKSFGGHKHRLVLGRKRIWPIPPLECGLGFRELLDDLGVPGTPASHLDDNQPQATIRAKWCEFRQWCSQQLECNRTLTYGGIEERLSKQGLWKGVKRYADTALAMFDEADKCEPAEVARQDALLFAGHLDWLKEQITAVMQ